MMVRRRLLALGCTCALLLACGGNEASSGAAAAPAVEPPRGESPAEPSAERDAGTSATAGAIVGDAAADVAPPPQLPQPSPSSPRDAGAATTPAVKVVVSVDWEGESLDQANMARMAWIRAQLPDVPMVHLLNAAYYTKPGASAPAVTLAIREALRPGDELGVHVHAWKSLFEASGVRFKASPNLFGEPIGDCSYDCGFDVPLSAYSEAELRKVLAFSVSTLERNGFGRGRAFRAGAWIATDAVKRALAAEGFVYEHSPVPWTFLRPSYRGTLLEQTLQPLWAGITSTSQPYVVTTPNGDLREIPDNGCLADYMTASAMLGVFEANVARFQRAPQASVVVSIGFHQESAEDWYDRLVGAVQGIQRRAATAHLPVRFVTSTEAAEGP